MEDSEYHTLIRRMEFLADCIMAEKRQVYFISIFYNKPFLLKHFTENRT